VVTSNNEAEGSSWVPIVAKYQSPDLWRSGWQILTSFVPFGVSWYLMYLSLGISYWLTLALSVLASGFLVRIFIIQHDCGHGSFLKTRRANHWLGRICGVLTLTPYGYWRKNHATHHARASNLDERGIGDISTITVNEYLQLSRWGKLKYRIYRNPLFLFSIGPVVRLVVLQRFYSGSDKVSKAERLSVHGTNLAIAVVVLVMILTIGLEEFLLVQTPIVVLSAVVGTWLFYVQHQFEGTYWAHRDEWDYAAAGLRGSSFLKLPRVLQWFTGNIGFHHIHHLSPRIPNYRLQKCHEENPMLQRVHVLTLASSLKTLFLALWDEQEKKLVGFGHLRRMGKAPLST
jgi:omega-6 fatty acid desaturase (delta-12 desaturase)